MTQTVPPPPTVRSAPWWRGWPRWVYALVGVVLVAVVVAPLMAGTSSPMVQAAAAAYQTKPAEPAGVDNGDGFAALACQHFRNVTEDAVRGMSEADLRSKIREVNDDAQASRTAGIESNAGAMVEAVVAGDVEAFSASAQAFSDACVTVGL